MKKFLSSLIKNKIFLTILVLVVMAGIFYAGMCYGVYKNKKAALKTSTQANLHGQNPITSGSAISSIGTVTSIDSKKIDIKDSKGATKTFSLDPKIAILSSSGKPAQFDSIKVGDRVLISAKMNKDKTYTATRVRQVLVPKTSTK